MTQARIKNNEKTLFTPGGAAGPGRPPGRKNKLSRQAIEEARTAFGPLVSKVISHITAHLKAHDGKADCATCRHCWDVVLAYFYGRPTQRHELDLPTEAERLLRDLGMEATPEAVGQVIDLARERERRVG